MAQDKSATHVKVVKNGIEGWIIKNVWEQMKERGKMEGFSEIANTPPEVMELKRKTVEFPEVDVELTGDIEEKAKAKTTKKK